MKWLCFHSRSNSPISSQQSSPPISPGCENQINVAHLQYQFKQPNQGFLPYYNVCPSQLMITGSSGYNQHIESGKPAQVSIDKLFINLVVYDAF